IGGDFPISPNDLKGIASFSETEGVKMFSNGRTALMAILKHISENSTQKRKIYLPYYICHSVIEACKLSGYNVSFYEITESFNFPISELNKLEQNTVLLTINYFGFVDDNSIVEEIKQKRPDIVTISDRVQDFYRLKDSIADYSFTSLRKAFPIPEGGLVFTKHIDFFDNFSYPENYFYKEKLLGSLLKGNGADDTDYLFFFEKGEQILDESTRIEKSSIISQYLYHKFNISEAQQIRQRNYDFIYSEGKKIGIDFIFEYKDHITPLSVPILIKDRDRIRKNLMKKNVFLPVHWPLSSFYKDSKKSKEIARNEISLIIDQRYNLKHMEYQLDTLKQIL
ncbi:MAG: hypothetical protein ACOCWG_05835, partial [bacterium]